MVSRIDSGTTGPISQPDPKDVEISSKPKDNSSTVENSTTPAEDKSALASHAAARAGESALSGAILASQLQSQVQTPSAATPPSQGPLLFEGKHEPASTKDFQKQLNEWRSERGLKPIKEDGIFGPETKGAVKDFQEANGLKKDGIVGDNTRSRLTLENNSDFKKLDPSVQDQIRNRMNDSQKDPTSRQLLLTIGTDPTFAKLSKAEQDAALKDISTSASSLTQKTLQGMSNDELLKIAESPGGQERLNGMKFALQQGPVSPGSLKELDRLNSATFTPAGGLKLKGSEADKAAYLSMVRREMLTSPTFAKTMNEINADKAHPVTVNIGRDMPNVRLDVDRGNGLQDVDLNDFDKLPKTPGASNPHAITQGEVLSHAMREARQRALGQNHDQAHEAAIVEENQYRKDIGQTSTRKLPPNDEDRVDNDLGDTTLVIHFDGAPDEELKFDKKQRLQ
jgi:peptidoglycan hydrolase-like protein with peptidoglycan-binding domain